MPETSRVSSEPCEAAVSAATSQHVRLMHPIRHTAASKHISHTLDFHNAGHHQANHSFGSICKPACRARRLWVYMRLQASTEKQQPGLPAAPYAEPSRSPRDPPPPLPGPPALTPPTAFRTPHMLCYATLCDDMLYTIIKYTRSSHLVMCVVYDMCRPPVPLPPLSVGAPPKACPRDPPRARRPIGVTRFLPSLEI